MCRAVVEELYRTGKFEQVDREADEDEHSIEMQLPYIVKMMAGCVVLVVGQSGACDHLFTFRAPGASTRLSR